MSSDPKWYEALPDWAQEAVDQAAHVAMGFGLAAVGTAAAAWAFFHWREFVQQAPIERVYDTERDMRFGIIGACVGQFVFWAWTGALTVWLSRLALVAALLVGAAGTAQAVDYEALWKNTDPERAVTWVRLCDASGCSRAVAVDCAPGATCRTRFVDPPAGRNVFVAVSTDGAEWSAPSNAIATDACLLSKACRFDVDRSGTVTIADFSELLKLLGTSYR